MPDQFSEMDDWTSEQVAQFKEEGQVEQLERTRALAPAAVAGVGMVIAEGDSWFDYLPGTDIINCLRRNHGYVIENFAKAGDTLENMIYGTSINRQFQRVSPTIESVLRRMRTLQPKVFLFSGGGNDVAGDEFESYLNHKSSGLPALREPYVNDMLTLVFRTYFEDLIAKVAAASPATHILVHGYGHTVPTGRAVDWLFVTFAGPWLRPALARKGIFDPAEQRTAVFALIDRFNAMLADLDQQHANFHHIDLRDLVNPDTDWANELHLRNSAFARVAQRINEKIQAL
jgi:hypothetical protein